ncbi:uncharacterized protein LOC122650166 [Telopea speciosissima]|uniref:uncharacterized protein LOC122650166 n=1 Tax=Telopea speciosissima TaxID=54955 RepID=UPI001CC4CE61|nr:uncharacterized protein LOC122650166 [Telopea speciosissima]
MEEESIVDGFSFRSSESDGMESVVASVSGYHGMERFKLIKLITQTGANYVGTMTRSTTHLVCRKFEGRKYELAKNLGTTVVSHRWFEDCAKEGKRLPEHHYIMQSGEEVGPLLWDVPLGKKNSFSKGKNGKALYDQSNIHKDTVQRVTDVGCTDDVEVAWTGSHLSKENLFPHCGMGNKGSHKIKRRTTHKTLKQECRLRATKCSLDLLVSGAVRIQNEESASPSTMPYGNQKRNIHSAVGSTSTADPTRKGRRLVKKDALGGILDSSVFKCEQEFSPTEAGNQLINTNAASDDINTMRNEIDQVAINVASDDSSDLRNENDQAAIQESGFADSRENSDEGLEEIGDMLLLNCRGPSDNLDRLDEGALPTHERTLENDFFEIKEHVDGALGHPGELRELADLPTSTELSCVICWTDFSSTRGVLPCGHRFCYSCIQGWADHMASSRKVATCPLCKGRFMSIMKVDCAASSDQKIYSQSIPFSSLSTDIFMLPDRENSSFGGQSSGMVCSECRCREPEDLLISCHLCQSKWVHSYCLDPPLDPWACLHCRDLRTLYYHMR